MIIINNIAAVVASLGLLSRSVFDAASPKAAQLKQLLQKQTLFHYLVSPEVSNVMSHEAVERMFIASGSGSPDCMAVYGWTF